MPDYIEDTLAGEMEEESQKLVQIMRRRPSDLAGMRARTAEAIDAIARLRGSLDAAENALIALAVPSGMEKG